MKIKLPVLVFAAFVVIFTASIAEACSCAMGGGGVCQSYWTTRAVFTGKVIGIEEVVFTANGGRAYGLRSKRVKFAVIDPFRGVTEQTAEVATGSGGGDCGYRFEMSETYLVFAHKNDGVSYSTSICTRTKRLSDATEDLAYIRGLSEAKPGSRISGKIAKYLVRRSEDAYTPNPPMPNIPVVIQSEKDRFETSTDPAGDFSFDGIPAGKYKLTASAPRGYIDKGTSAEIEVFDKGCAVRWLVMTIETAIKGTVTDHNGMPAKDVYINLVPIETVNKDRQPDIYGASTDENGRYEIDELPDGKYYLGTRLTKLSGLDKPFPRSFFPGTTDISKAAAIEIREGMVLENYDFRLPPPLSSRTISGRVTLPKDFKAREISICVREALLCEGRSDMEVAADGTFKFAIHDGITYNLQVYATSTDGKQKYAEPVAIPEQGSIQGLKIEVKYDDRRW